MDVPAVAAAHADTYRARGRVSWLLITAAMLVLWAGIAAVRRKQEAMPRGPAGPQGPGGPRNDDDDEIDRAMLEAAEREVQDLDPLQRPDDGFEGDDWGPGAGTRPS